MQTFRRTDMGHIEHTVTVDDPKFYTKPWKNERTFTLMNAGSSQYSCEENNRSLWEGRLKLWLPPWAKRKEMRLGMQSPPAPRPNAAHESATPGDVVPH